MRVNNMSITLTQQNITPLIVNIDYAALPAVFTQKLESQEAEEESSVTLHCELSKAGFPVEWRKGAKVLTSGEKYQMKQKASVNELLISTVAPEDSGDYSCVCGEQKTSASINIKGRRRASRVLQWRCR